MKTSTQHLIESWEAEQRKAQENNRPDIVTKARMRIKELKSKTKAQ